MPVPETAVRRTYQTYLYATCFVTVLISLIAAAVALNSLVKIVAPGIETSGAGRELVRRAATGSLISSLIFGAVAFGVFAWHWTLARRVREELADLEREQTPLPSLGTPATSVETPTEDPVEVPEAVRPRPRTRTPKE